MVEKVAARDRGSLGVIGGNDRPQGGRSINGNKGIRLVGLYFSLTKTGYRKMHDVCPGVVGDGQEELNRRQGSCFVCSLWLLVASFCGSVAVPPMLPVSQHSFCRPLKDDRLSQPTWCYFNGPTGA